MGEHRPSTLLIASLVGKIVVVVVVVVVYLQYFLEDRVERVLLDFGLPLAGLASVR